MANKIATGPTATLDDDKYRTEDDARTLERSAEVMGDATRHRNAKKHLMKKHNAVAKMFGKK